MSVDIFFVSIAVLFFQYIAVLIFITLAPRWPSNRPLGFYIMASIIGTIGFTSLVFLIKFYFNYTFISIDFKMARNCMGLIFFLLICKIYGLMPLEFMIKHLDLRIRG